MNWFKKLTNKLCDNGNTKVSPSFAKNEIQYVDLMPVTHADEDGEYSKALKFAIDSIKISNIALTGSYGSGKSSIIKTFELKNDYKLLNISLASFNEQNKGTIKETEQRLIERSILQQLLYGADANKLPYSRFKRINIPEYPLVKSAIVVLWLIIIAFLNSQKTIISVPEIFTLDGLLFILFISIAIALPIVVISDLYKSIFGISFKKLSITKGEFEFESTSDDSILNRHLDEIIYFFQVTDYNVVVIEDLDRFGSPEIFVKLREINKLINDNEKVKKQINFLYALKDDVFKTEDRTKFFDFLIPVVPEMNNTTALEKMTERLCSSNFNLRINSLFMREVSLYINDLRLLHNILNEFFLYAKKLNSEHLDKTKLLAMTIYKNVYPNDFEALHHSTGAFYSICQLRNTLHDICLKQVNDNISSIHRQIKSAENESLKNTNDLIKLFLGHISLNHPNPHNRCIIGMYIDSQPFHFTEAILWEDFEKILSDSNIKFLTLDNYYNNEYTWTTNKSFQQFEKEIFPNSTFSEKKQNIDNQDALKRQELQTNILSLESKKNSILTLPLYKLLQLSDYQIETIFSNKDTYIKKPELLTYLVKNGHIDEHYHMYISKFHEGRLTHKDRDFLLTIRSFKKPHPNQTIDTPEEVILNMRSTDFEQSYVLNQTLIDYLLVNSQQYKSKLSSALRFIANNYQETHDFFTIYFNSGNNLAKLTNQLALSWPKYAAHSVIDDFHHAPKHIASILEHVDSNYICDEMNVDNIITKYLNKNFLFVYDSGFKSDSQGILNKLNLKLLNLESVKDNEVLLNHIYSENLYQITPENIILILKTYFHCNKSDCETANLSTIRAIGGKRFQEYIYLHLEYYIDNVMLALPNNVNEDKQAIMSLLENKYITQDKKEQIISKQNHIFENIEELPLNLWKHALSEVKIAISWKNIAIFLHRYETDEESNSAEEILNDLFKHQPVIDKLSEQNIDIDKLGEDRAIRLSKFIITNKHFSIGLYEKLIQCVSHTYKNFPDTLSNFNERLMILTKYRLVKLNKQSFDFAEENNELVALLITKNIDEFFANKTQYPINDIVRELIICSDDVLENRRLNIAKDITNNWMTEGFKSYEKLSQLLLNFNGKLDAYNPDNLALVIINTSDIEKAIKLFSSCMHTFNEELTFNTLLELPKPYNNIATFGKKPKLSKTKVNSAFVHKLKELAIISSYKTEGEYIKIYTFSKKPSL